MHYVLQLDIDPFPQPLASPISYFKSNARAQLAMHTFKQKKQPHDLLVCHKAGTLTLRTDQ